MLTFYQALILGIGQGISELFPISSLGHSVLLPQILKWQIDQSNDNFLIFLVATHFATAIILFLFYLKDWILIIGGVIRSLFKRNLKDNYYGRLGWLIILGTAPAGLLGLLFQKKIQNILAVPLLVAVVLILNGMMLWWAEIIRNRNNVRTTEGGDERLSKMRWSSSLWIGLSQSLALIPGFSRTGTTMAGGLLAGYHHEDAARFSFLLTTPLILAAAILKLPALFKIADPALLMTVTIGSVSAAIAAYFSVRFLIRFFKSKTLKPFAIYCVAAGIICLIIFLI